MTSKKQNRASDLEYQLAERDAEIERLRSVIRDLIASPEELIDTITGERAIFVSYETESRARDAIRGSR